MRCGILRPDLMSLAWDMGYFEIICERCGNFMKKKLVVI